MFRPVLMLAAVTLLTAELPAQIEEGNAGDGAQAAYLALTSTPVGALPPTVRSYLVGAERGLTLRGRFGNLDEAGDVSRRNFALGVDVPVGRMTVGLTAGTSTSPATFPTSTTAAASSSASNARAG